MYEIMALPNNMELILQLSILASGLDKILHRLQFIFRSGFDPPGIVKDKVTARVSELTFNVMFSTLINHDSSEVIIKDLGPLNLS